MTVRKHAIRVLTTIHIPAGPLQLKGAAKQNFNKKNSKLNKFENDEGTVSVLGPIPSGENKIFAGLHFLLTCADAPRRPTVKVEKTDKPKIDTNEETKSDKVIFLYNLVTERSYHAGHVHIRRVLRGTPLRPSP